MQQVGAQGCGSAVASAPARPSGPRRAASGTSSSGAANVRRQQGRRAAPPTRTAAATVEAAPTRATVDANQRSREGAYEAALVEQQATKADPEQPALADALPPFDPAAETADVAIVGAGPAGLALAAELAGQGLSVALVSMESKFVNNYGVWLDEFQDLGLTHTLDAGGCWWSRSAGMWQAGHLAGTVLRCRRWRLPCGMRHASLP